jgi:cell fate regulator YaaT (PSP1 superfamily)
MGNMVEIQLGEYRPVYQYDLNGVDTRRGDLVILEVERGSDFGRIVSDVTRECKSRVEAARGKVLRVATEGDVKQIENNRMKAQDAKGVCARKITERKLPMRIVKSEYTFDSSKIIFSFTADGRVDFRGLVKDLAKVFRVRIELKQIGVRDKAKVVGG